MFDFTSGFWTWWIAFFSIGGLIGCGALVYWMTVGAVPAGAKVEPMGHVWDENLEELNHPLPRWWLLMFYFLIVIAAVYLLLYPGIGAFRGLLGWTNDSQYQGELKAAEERYGPLFEGYGQKDLAALARDPAAMQTGARLFATYCTVCHGSDARGAKGFPNLRDGDWLYGNDPQAIKTSILAGRQGNMPAWETMLGREGVYNVTEYVRSLSGKTVDAQRAAAGKAKYAQVCVACHGADGKGNQALGAPNLTDDTWLYGGSHDDILATIRAGRAGVMPAHEKFLGNAKVHLLSAYIYSLSEAK
jgi:cytochrome c oxidase cbb3-type subunit 3